MKRVSKITMLCCWMLMITVSAFCQQKSNIKLENKLVGFSFSPTDGTFSFTDKRDNRVCIEQAFFQVNQYKSNEGYSFQWKFQNITDEMGVGKKLIIEGKKQGLPSLVLEIFIYNDKGNVVLNTGIINTTNASLRIMQFFPLKGIAYKGFAFDDYKTLDGESGVAFTKVSTTDTLHSRNNLLVSFGKKGERKRSLVMGGLSYNEFQKYASVVKQEDYLAVELKGDDPVGKLVDAKSTYILKDKFYIDFITDNRFESLEKYGQALSIANHVDIRGVTIPILNFWYCFIPKYGGDQFRDNSTGTVEEMLEVAKTGFLKYGPVGLRLEPDDYALPSNQQGW